MFALIKLIQSLFGALHSEGTPGQLAAGIVLGSFLGLTPLVNVHNDVVVSHETFGVYAVQFDRPDEIKFCENETNAAKVFGGQETGHPCKDGLHDYVVRGRKDAVDPAKGTKAAGIYRRTIAAGASTTIRVRLSAGPAKPAPSPMSRKRDIKR